MPRIDIDWLADHVEVPAGLTAQQLARDLVKVGLEEEEIHRPDVSGPIVVGKVLTVSKEKQTNGKTINYSRVDVGEHNDAPGEGKEPADVASRGIVCGAHNYEVGDYVVVSLPGAVLPGDFQISARKTYGHVSDGMICSERELGLGEDHSGIIVLASSDAEAADKGLPAIGEDVLDYLGLSGEVLEINVTPDRGYCFAMRGVAREYAHSTGAAFTDRGLAENLAGGLPEVNGKGFKVKVDDDSPIHGVPGCDRFVTRIVRGVDPHAPSPKWLQDRLTAAGMRPISLAVDATNYVMLDLGQPLHAYDLDKLVEPIVVRRARPGETLVTLDDQERALDGEDLVITDSEGGEGERVIGLAGTMGGLDTEITADTTNVLIEAAHFDAVSVARMARKHKLPSEASKRFERGVDPAVAPVAAQRVADLLVEYGGGTIDEANFDFNETVAPSAQVFDTREVARLTGLDLPKAEITGVLEQIGCAVADAGDDLLEVTPPSWRPDLVGPAHFVEEVTRLVGYDEVASKLPAASAGEGLTTAQRHRRDIGRALAEQGWVEVLSYPFVAGSVFDRQQISDDDERRLAVRLSNPLQDDAPYMRTSILDSLLDTARMNVARGNPTVAIFEAGLVTRPAGIQPATTPGVGARPSDAELAQMFAGIPAQPHHVAGVATPTVTERVAGFAAQVWDWRDAIEAVKTAGRTIDLDLKVKAAERAPFHPGRCAALSVGKKLIGHAGELDPRVCKAFDLPARTVAFEFDVDALIAARGSAALSILPVLTSPAAKEDIALVVDDSTTAAAVANTIRDAAGALLEDVHLFDVYTGDQIPEGKKSLAFALRLRADHTLNAEEIAQVRNKVVKACAKAFGAELRS
ncbi:phenylalanine--tRNA ligase subunit beta [Trueperella bialowiezensis]|uniref:Phenylalanine--tRNA ligase beta subunit n=1 Tax=Trueperella bialowiezensis TaxID=312285 RepID=A0A3S4X765_9ACTO|nr:phenylalanine--tRNA ligase subunit beta [Trueperella bialowiezensis]VEI14133.1 Phenylalanine--tRNA ligase beta subunit [Trueperella bialowiezensis]